jgi:polyisoprenoid-binding protein YceI
LSGTIFSEDDAMRLLASAMVFAVLACVAEAGEHKYAINGENTKIEWTGTKPGDKHDGGFKKVSGSAVLAEGAGLKITVDIDTTSLYSDNEKLTGHLKAADFFSVKEHPTAKFTSTKIEKGDKGFIVTGDLTLVGKTKQISFPATITTGDSLVINATFAINKTDFGMTYGQGKIGDMVAIKLSVNAKK